jgi:hypothetical protein
MNSSEAKFCSSCGTEINIQTAAMQNIPPVKKSRWPFIIAIVSVALSVIAVSVEEQLPAFSNSLSTFAGLGLFTSAIWYFTRRIKSKGWRRVDKIVVGIIAVLLLLAIISLASL